MNIQEQENFKMRGERVLDSSFGQSLQEKIKSLDGEDFTEKDFPGATPYFIQKVSFPLGYVRVKVKDESRSSGYWQWGYMLPQDKREEKEIKDTKEKISVLELENETLRKNIEEARG